MNTKGKGESERAIIGMVLVAIMIASVFAGISASAIAGDNETNESVDDGVVAGSQVGGEAVSASAAGTVTVDLAPNSPSANIANESANFTDILYLRFSASGESANITKLVIEEAGTIHGTTEITGVGVNYSTDSSETVLATGTFSGDNGTAELTLPGGYEVPVGTLKDLYVWVNTTNFDLGDTIKLKLTSFNATGLASGDEMTKEGTPESYVIAGVGKLTVSVGPNSTGDRTINAGENTSIVLMQLNFTATIGACTLDSITLTENGTANGTRDFSAIYLVNDTDADGVWDPDEPVKGTPATTFSADNGTATITNINNPIPLNSPVYMLVVVNTTNQFWSGDTLAVNISATADVTASSGGVEWGIYGLPVSSNVTTGRAKIQVTAGSKQPYLDYVLEGKRGLVENAQLNFTAIAGQVNITQITLEQWTTTNWATASGETYPKIYIDEDRDGNVTSYDTPLNISAGNFTTNNVTLANCTCNQTGQNETTFTDWAELVNGTTDVWYHNTSLYSTATPWWINVSVQYINFTDQSNTTWLNFTDSTLTGEWKDCSVNFSDGVKNITGVTYYNESGNNITKFSFDIVASSCVVTVTLDRNLTIGSRTETDAGQESKLVIIAVNTTNSWTSGNKTKALPNTITKYGNWSNYVAYDNTTGLNTRIYQSNDPSTGTTKAVSATTVPTVSNAVFLVKPGSESIIANVGAGTNLTPVLQLNFSYSGTVSGLSSSTVYIRQIVVSTNGTVNESSNVTACLVVDTDNDGAVSPGESVRAIAEYTTDNETVKLTPSSPIELTITNPDVSAAGKATYKNVLIAVNTSSDIELGKTLQFYIDNSSMDYIADTGVLMMTNATSAKIVGNSLYAAGTITAIRTGNVTGGTVSSEVNENFVELMQLKFTASSTEAVNITSINVTWNGTGTGATKTSGIGIFNDTDADGEWDATDTEPILNATTFVGNVAFLNLSFNDNNITVQAGGSVYAVIYVNTTAQGINASDEIKVNITAAPYLNYTAYGISSNVTITDLQTTAISSATMTAEWTGNVSVTGYNLTDTTWVEGAQTNFPVLALNFSAVNETVNITSITLTASGSANESGNVTNVRLVEDTGTIGQYDGEDIVSDAKDFTADDGTVTLTTSPQIKVLAGSFKRVLVIADITANVQAGENITISLENPSTDYVAMGYYSGTRVQDSSTDAISNTTWATGNVTVSLGTNTTATGPITAMNATFVPIMQLNFSATPEMEDVNITGITLNASGLSSDAHNDTWGVGVYNDTNGNGVIDDEDVELGNGTFNPNGTAIISFHTNLTINGTASQEWANRTFNNTVVYVNTSDNFTFGDVLQVKLVSYNATGNTSRQTLTDFGVPITSNKLTGTGNITVVNGTKTPSPQYILAGANTTVPVWQLNLSTNLENATLNSITLTFNGTAAVTDISAVDLYYDANSNGTVEAANDTLIASGTISDSKVTLEPTETFYINTTVKSLLVTVNTTANFKDNDTIAFNITVNTTAPKMATPDVKATGVNSTTVIATNYTVPLSSNTLTGYGSIDLYAGDVQSDTTNQTTNTNVSVMELNFSAPRGKINITNITVTWNGTADTNKLTNISIWKDDGDGTFNESSDTLINMTTFGTGNKTIETLVAGGAEANLTVDGVTNNVYIVVKIGTALTADNTLGFDVNQTLGVGYNATCNETGQIPYSTMNTTTPGEVITGQISVTGAPVNQIELYTGWNLISLWLIPSNTSIEAVTSEIETNLDAVWYYDASVPKWESYSPGFAGAQDLTEMTAGWGYWVKMKANDTLPVTGSFLPSGNNTPPTYTVYEGWNLIGFHSENETAVNATTYLEGVSWKEPMYKWDALNKQYDLVKGSDNMEQGKGYWLAVTETEATIYPY